MSDVFVVIAQEGEYSDRISKLCGVFTNEETAKSLVSEKSALAAEFDVLFGEWREKHSQSWYIKDLGERIWPPDRKEFGESFTYIKIPLDVWVYDSDGF